MIIKITDQPLNLQELIDDVATEANGGVVAFETVATDYCHANRSCVGQMAKFFALVDVGNVNFDRAQS